VKQPLVEEEVQLYVGDEVHIFMGPGCEAAALAWAKGVADLVMQMAPGNFHKELVVVPRITMRRVVRHHHSPFPPEFVPNKKTGVSEFIPKMPVVTSGKRRASPTQGSRRR
jgi:hypothetical protein